MYLGTYPTYLFHPFNATSIEAKQKVLHYESALRISRLEALLRAHDADADADADGHGDAVQIVLVPSPESGKTSYSIRRSSHRATHMKKAERGREKVGGMFGWGYDLSQSSILLDLLHYLDATTRYYYTLIKVIDKGKRKATRDRRLFGPGVRSSGASAEDGEVGGRGRYCTVSEPDHPRLIGGCVPYCTFL